MESAPKPAPVRRKIREYATTVTEIVRETPDMVTLMLSGEGEPFEYSAGQFLSLDPHQFPSLQPLIAELEKQKGKKEPVRAYSMASAPHEKHLAFTVKEEEFVPGVTRYQPLLSPLLVRSTPVGTPLKIIGFTGPYVLPEDIEQRTDHVVHIVAGSGAVPNYSILKHSLHRGQKLRQTFIYSNKTWADICYREALEKLQAENPGRLNVVHTLTREKDEARFVGNVRRGRITQALFEELIPDAKTAYVYLCGPAITPWDRREALVKKVQAPPRFLETALEYLHTIGITNDRIKRESYG